MKDSHATTVSKLVSMLDDERKKFMSMMLNRDQGMAREMSLRDHLITVENERDEWRDKCHAAEKELWALQDKMKKLKKQTS